MPHFEPTWQSLHQYSPPDWFRDAKFGIFIHWGVYSVPAAFNEWYPRSMYLQGSEVFQYHRRTWGQDFGYKDFIPLFSAERFDPAAWVDLFCRAGARYIVPVAEHHDGFAMYASALTHWNAAAMGPQRDVMGELAGAAQAAGLTFGLSSHRAEHWWYMNGGRALPSDVQSADFADLYGPAMPSPDPSSSDWERDDWSPPPDTAFLEDWLQRCIELVDRFQPRQVYFDWWIHQQAFKPWLPKFAAYYYNRVPDGIITYKLDAFEKGTAVFDIERGYAAGILPEPWQACTSVSKNSWGYIHAHDYKQPAAIIHHLVDVVSKNGCMLLNVGPRPDGTLPEQEQMILEEIGRWLALNGSAIYGSRPWRLFGEGPTQIPTGQFSDNAVTFTSQDIRFTTQGSRLFAITLGDPGPQLTIRSLATEQVSRVKMPGWTPELAWSQDEAGLHIQVPPERPGNYAWVFELEVES